VPDSKRHKGGKTPPKGTGRPSGKDRSSHEAKRGKPMSLEALSKEMPSEEQLLTYARDLIQESDRSSAIMAGALVEQALYVMICAKIADPGDGKQASWFEGINAPFRSFEQKIALGRALAVYDQPIEDRLNIIRKIRNVFAHRSLPLDFSHPSLKPLVAKLNPRPETEYPTRYIFAAYCVAIVNILIKTAIQEGGKPMTLSIPLD
jgi:hypothetical protein